jgi:hypothetical protein
LSDLPQNHKLPTAIALLRIYRLPSALLLKHTPVDLCTYICTCAFNMCDGQQSRSGGFGTFPGKSFCKLYWEIFLSQPAIFIFWRTTIGIVVASEHSPGNHSANSTGRLSYLSQPFPHSGGPQPRAEITLPVASG